MNFKIGTDNYQMIKKCHYKEIIKINLSELDSECTYETLNEKAEISKIDSEYILSYKYIDETNDFIDVDILQKKHQETFNFKICIKLIKEQGNITINYPQNSQIDTLLKFEISWDQDKNNDESDQIYYNIYLSESSDIINDTFIENINNTDYDNIEFEKYSKLIQKNQKNKIFPLKNYLKSGKKYYLRVVAYDKYLYKKCSPVINFITNNFVRLPISDNFDKNFEKYPWKYSNNTTINNMSQDNFLIQQNKNIINIKYDNSSQINHDYSEYLQIDVINNKNLCYCDFLYYQNQKFDKYVKFSIFINDTEYQNIKLNYDKWTRIKFQIPLGQYTIKFKLFSDYELQGISDIYLQDFNIGIQKDEYQPIIFPNIKDINVNKNVILDLKYFNKNFDDQLIDVFISEDGEIFNKLIENFEQNILDISQNIQYNKLYYCYYSQKNKYNQNLITNSNIFKIMRKEIQIYDK